VGVIGGWECLCGLFARVYRCWMEAALRLHTKGRPVSKQRKVIPGSNFKVTYLWFARITIDQWCSIAT